MICAKGGFSINDFIIGFGGLVAGQRSVGGTPMAPNRVLGQLAQVRR
jgi:hypothetical protein